jgi:hypothetical protein
MQDADLDRLIRRMRADSAHGARADERARAAQN